MAATLSSGGHPGSAIPSRHHEDDTNLIAFGGNNTSGPIDLATARSSRANRYDFETDTFLVANTVRGADGHHGHSSPRGDGNDNLGVADPISASEGRTYTHEGSHNFRTHNLVDGVRRLTPLECERLQGFPDGWTDLDIVDSHRYRMLGNAVDTVVAQWLGHRLVAVDATLDQPRPSWQLLPLSLAQKIFGTL